MKRIPTSCLLLALNVLLAVGGCLFEEQELEQYPCSAAHPECPEGMWCIDNSCVEKGSIKDSGRPDTTVDIDEPVEEAGGSDSAEEGDLTVDASVDGAVLDAPMDNAVDVAMDAPPFDAPAFDAPAFDAPAFDAPADVAVDGPVMADAPAADIVAADGVVDATNDILPDGSCVSGTEQPCYTGIPATQGVGECKAGTRSCTNGAWGACEDEVTPVSETCDGLDNDCNGDADDGLTPPDCTKQDGVCAGAKQECGGASSWLDCEDTDYEDHAAAQGHVYEADEVSCDGQDNDCDEEIDEGCSCLSGTSQLCGSDIGECVKGSQLCINGQWSPCTGGITAAPEICDNKDNNCDGIIDQFSEDCYTGPPGTEGEGECTAGFRMCAGGSWSGCAGEVTPTEEICDNKDNDCDGNIDFYSKPCYTGPPGTVGVGTCHGGMRTCVQGSWGSCINEVVPSVEYCDGIDTDCDGDPDNDLTPPNCANQTGVCDGSKQTCGGEEGWQPCTEEDYQDHAADQGTTYEVPNETSCDEEDNDCDGETDENVTEKFFLDEDGDGFGSDSSHPVYTCEQPNGYADNDEDCNDWDKYVFPGQTEYFVDPRVWNDPSGAKDPFPFDYDCDKKESPVPGHIADHDLDCELIVSTCYLVYSDEIIWCNLIPECGEFGYVATSCTNGQTSRCITNCPPPQTPCTSCPDKQQACR